MTVLLLAALLAPTSARASELQGTYAVGCVESQVSLTFSIFDRARPNRALFSDRAVLDTACTDRIGPQQADVFRMVLGDMCQLLGVDATSCLDVVRGDLGEMEQLTSLPSLDTLVVSPFGEDEGYAELSLGFAGQYARVLPASFRPDGSFETSEALPAVEPSSGKVFECTATADMTAKGRVSAVRESARVEVGRTRTFLCRTGADELVLKLEFRTTQRAGDLVDDIAQQ